MQSAPERGQINMRQFFSFARIQVQHLTISRNVPRHPSDTEEQTETEWDRVMLLQQQISGAFPLKQANAVENSPIVK